MKQIFIASLCREGILGGGIIADDEGITYKTGKVTVSPRFRNLEMKYGDIQSISKTSVLFFPAVSIAMKSGDEFKFIVFARERFCSLLSDKISE